MSDLTASQIQSDLSSIRSALPGAVVTATIGGNDYDAIMGNIDADDELEVMGRITQSARRIIIDQSALDANAQTVTPRETEVTIDSTVYLVISTLADPLGAFLQIGLDSEDYYQQ